MCLPVRFFLYLLLLFYLSLLFYLYISQFKFRMCSTLPIVGADPCVRPMSERHISTGLASVVRLSALGRHMGLPLQAAV